MLIRPREDAVDFLYFLYFVFAVIDINPLYRLPWKVNSNKYDRYDLPMFFDYIYEFSQKSIYRFRYHMRAFTMLHLHTRAYSAVAN